VESYPGFVHGGMVATLLDGGLANCSFVFFSEKITLIASLDVKFRKTAPTKSFYVLKAEVVKVDRRRVRIKGRLLVLGKNAQEIGNFDDGQVVAEAEGVYVAQNTKGLPTFNDFRGEFITSRAYKLSYWVTT
jgi:acyl-coenzyme A thioesterase PaaI-like protein